MFENLTQQERDTYSNFASGALFQAGLSRYVCELGINAFGYESFLDSRCAMLFDTYGRFLDDYEEVGADLWEYTSLNDIDLALPPQFSAAVDWSRPFDYGAYLGLFEKSIYFDTTPVPFVNASLKAFNNAFQGAIRFAGVALSLREYSFVKALFGKNGILRKTAFNTLLMQTKARAFEYPNGLILKPSSIKPETGCMPLADSNVEDPYFQYAPSMFIFQSFPNDDNTMKPGMQISIPAPLPSGTLVRPDSPECEQMVADITDAWLKGLTYDNRVRHML